MRDRPEPVAPHAAAHPGHTRVARDSTNAEWALIGRTAPRFPPPRPVHTTTDASTHSRQPASGPSVGPLISSWLAWKTSACEQRFHQRQRVEDVHLGDHLPRAVR